MDKVNRSTDYTGSGFHKGTFIKSTNIENQNRMSWQGTPQVNHSIAEIGGDNVDRKIMIDSRYGNRMEYGGAE
jgi:hypothetical protein